MIINLDLELMLRTHGAIILFLHTGKILLSTFTKPVIGSDIEPVPATYPANLLPRRNFELSPHIFWISQI